MGNPSSYHWVHFCESFKMIYALVCKNWKWKKTCIQIDCLLIGTGPDDHLGAVRLSKESQLDVALRNVCLLDTIDNDRSQPSAKPRYEHWWTLFYFIWLCQGKNVLGGCAFLAENRIKTTKKPILITPDVQTKWHANSIFSWQKWTARATYWLSIAAMQCYIACNMVKG